MLINPPMPPPPFPALPRGQAWCQPWRRRKLGRAGGGHRSPPKMLFFGNNPHYLPPLCANQTESLMPRTASCCLWEVTGRPRGGGRGGAGGGGGTFRAGWGFGPALIQVLNARETRTYTFKASRVGRAVYIRDSTVNALISPQPVHGVRLPRPLIRTASPAAPRFPACPAPASFLSSAMANPGRLSFTVRRLLDLPEQDAQHLRRREPEQRAPGLGSCASWLESERSHYPCE